MDDDPDILSLIAVVLRGEGYKVKTAVDGREGLEVVKRYKPDLILLDMKMPIMDGWTFARELREQLDIQTPIVVITAAADAKKRAEEIGAAGWVGKPFDLDALFEVVERHTG